MVGERRSGHCGNCGSVVEPGDTFCGVCGSRIPPDAQEAVPTQDIPTQVQPPPTVPGRSLLPVPWWFVGVGVLTVLVLGISVVAVTMASGSEEIEPVPGVSVEVPPGWVISSDSNQSGRITSSVDAVILVPEAYQTVDDPVGKAAEEDAPTIFLRKADTSECEPQPVEVKSLPAPPPDLGGYDSVLQAFGTMTNGKATVDGHTAPWTMNYGSVALPWTSSDLNTASEYPDYSMVVTLSVCIEDTGLVVETGESSPNLSGSSLENPGNPPTADRNAAVPEAREEAHRELQETYTANVEPMMDFLENIDTGSLLGRTDLDGLPTTFDPHNDALDDPFQGQLQEVAGSSEEPTTPSSASPEATTSPEEPTPVDLLQDFVSDYYDASAREDWTDTYSMLDEESQQEFTEEEWTEAQAAHEASSDSPPVVSATVEGPYFSHTQTPFSTNVSLTYEDGTSETVEVSLVSEGVIDEASDYYRYLTDQEVSDLKELLGEGAMGESTMSSTPEPTTSSPYGLSPEVEEQVRETAERYYYEVDSENWAATYYNLDSESKALFTEEEWTQKNQWYADNEGLQLNSMDVDVDMEGDEEARVTVDRTFTDGTSITRETVFVWNNTYWSHHLTEEEKEIFMPGVPYEEFVEAQQ